MTARLTLLFLLFSAPAWAEPLFFWQQTSVRYRLNLKWTLYGELQPRWRRDFKDEQALGARVALFRDLSQSVKLGIGYGKLPTFLPRRTDENRIYQQVDWAGKAEIWQFSGRFRMEERWIERVRGVILRTRFRTSMNWMPSDLGAYVSQELFLNLNHRERQTVRGFDQYRMSMGPRYEANSWTLEAGYVGQRARSFSRHSHWNHGILLNVGLSF